jgi:hypothetical protein
MANGDKKIKIKCYFCGQEFIALRWKAIKGYCDGCEKEYEKLLDQGGKDYLLYREYVKDVRIAARSKDRKIIALYIEDGKLFTAEGICRGFVRGQDSKFVFVQKTNNDSVIGYSTKCIAA